MPYYIKGGVLQWHIPFLLKVGFIMGYADIASRYVGIKEGTTGHHAIIDYYNRNIRPLPRNYRVRYTDAWCATFASVILKMGGAVNAPYECSVPRMWALAMTHGQIVKEPAINDLIIYDWGNNGSLDHVGIIAGVTRNTLKVIEGNYSNSVGIRNIKRSSNEIEGFIRVPTAVSQPVTTGDNMDKVVTDVLNGKYGNMPYRKINLERAGYNYSEVQNAVNARLNGSTNLDKVVSDVLKGRYGNGQQRKNNLEKAGYNYDEVQKAVNKKLGV